MTTTPHYFGETVRPHNATFAGHKASTFNVEESLEICKQLFEHSWKTYQHENYHLVWRDALDTAIQGCKGLLTMATEKHMQELTTEANTWFILFLTFTGISLIAVAALVYLISTMRQFVSLKKCLVSSWEHMENRPQPINLTKFQSPISTRPVVKNWASPSNTSHQTPSDGAVASQPQQTPSPSSDPRFGAEAGSSIKNRVNYPTQSLGRGETQVSIRMREEEQTRKEELMANINERYRDYQRSLWDLQRTGMPGMPPALYPSLSHLQHIHQGEEDPRLTREPRETTASHQDVSRVQDLSQGPD